MLEAGLLDPDMIFHFGSGIGPVWSWRIIKPFAECIRALTNRPYYMRGFEHYAD
ncbi:unnamed protein product [marine sediment metagenome]|uniref:Uncharacterized protein n=1 Tax=marine sediment metagenome TaxID=412755 RepID=X1MJ18_9ZZZZ